MKRVSRWLGWLWLLGTAGILVELVITGHTESSSQWIPLVLGTLGVIAYVLHALVGSSFTAACLKVLMALYLVAGATGITLHMQGKMEFKQESDPSLKGISLMLASLESKSPPALAPGALVQLGLLGFVWLWSAKEKS